MENEIINKDELGRREEGKYRMRRRDGYIVRLFDKASRNHIALYVPEMVHNT